MSYTLKLYAWEDASPEQHEAALLRFRQALDASLGDESLVLPVYGAYRRLVATYGDNPSEELLSSGELEILKAWRDAQSAAMTAALGPNRYMGDAEFEIQP